MSTTSSSERYSIVEPHPSARPQSYISTGRGGSGNVTRAPSSVTAGPSATGPAARASVSSLSKPRLSFISGRGGAGNAHSVSERAIFSFDEELERELSHERKPAPVFYMGRGGAGNARSGSARDREVSRRDSQVSNVSSRSSSSESGADVATRKMGQAWRKITGVA